MVLLVLLFSIFIAAIGAIGFFSPARLFQTVGKLQSPTGLYAAAGFRVVFGLALFFASDCSHASEVIRVVGIIILAAICIGCYLLLGLLPAGVINVFGMDRSVKSRPPMFN